MRVERKEKRVKRKSKKGRTGTQKTGRETGESDKIVKERNGEKEERNNGIGRGREKWEGCEVGKR